MREEAKVLKEIEIAKKKLKKKKLILPTLFLMLKINLKMLMILKKKIY